MIEMKNYFFTSNLQFFSFLQEGHYYRFDREQKYDVITIQDGGTHHHAEPSYDVIGGGRGDQEVGT